jgi:hypothetical protein
LKTPLTVLLMWLTISMGQAQDFDTLKIMSYNLLYYGETTSFCTGSNNPIAQKDVFLKVIMDRAKPDILVVNEMGASNVYVSRILEKALNVDGQTEYEAASIKNNGFSDLVNGIFYRGDKLELLSHKSVKEANNGSNLVRVVDIAQFYYRDVNLTAESDTVFIYVLAAHLKAGDSSSDLADRDIATEAVMDRLLDDYPPGYYMFCGDFNMQSSNEDAYQNLAAASNGLYRFYDPINQSGTWHNSASFAEHHTQSTRQSQTNGGCFSGGGMDDRFDLILASGQVIQDTGDVSYIDGSYRAFGQDGNHFNKAINDGANNSVPSTVLAALYELSDHLPVQMNFKVRLQESLPVDTTDTTGDSTTYIPFVAKPQGRIWTQNSRLRVDCFSPSGGEINIYSLDGSLSQSIAVAHGYNELETTVIKTGLYIVRLSTYSGSQVKKIWISSD